MKYRRRKVGVLIIIILIVIQFVQPERNIAEGPYENDISIAHDMPKDLHDMLVNKCYDCHSNNTRYPWYFSIQPVGWWLAAHVHEGKEHLNFSEFKTYSPKKAADQFEELEEVTEEGSMPLKAYLILNPEKELTEGDKRMILEWLKTVGK